MTSDPSDSALASAAAIVDAARGASEKRPQVTAFFDEATSSVSYLVEDPLSETCAVLDSVLDYDGASGRTATRSADRIASMIDASGLRVEWILETHAHADHLSAAPYLQDRYAGRLGIGREITQVQSAFGDLFNAGPDFVADGRPFDRLFADGECFSIGSLDAVVLHVPGHTPACAAYVIGDAVFAGDTLFMPDYGSARCDFPGGDAAQLYRSVRRLLRLPAPTRMFVCHDYLAPGRDQYAWETTIGEQRERNVHLNESVDETAFVEMRNARDLRLAVPKLLLPSVQVNMRGGRFPLPEANGISYLKIPLNAV